MELLCVIQYEVRGTDTAGVVLVITYHCETAILNVLSYELMFVLCYSILKVLIFYFTFL